MARSRFLAGLLLGQAMSLAAACGDGATSPPDAADAGDVDADPGDTPAGDADADAGSDAGPDADGDAPPEVTPDVPWDATRFFVSPTGDDSNPGTLEEPFATIGRARDAVRDVQAAEGIPPGGLVVALREGTYELTETLDLTADDSGRGDAPTWYASYPAETARLTGSVAVPATAVVPVPADSPVRSRLPAGAADQVRQVDLESLGITDLGTLERRGFSTWGAESALEPAIDGVMLEPARWPNRGQTDPEDLTADAIVAGDRFGDGTVFAYLGTTASGSADDGFANYSADVGGTTFFLYHCTWEWGGGIHRYWFLSPADPRTDPNCWPDAVTSWLASGNWPIPPLEAFGGEASETVIPRTRPVDFAENGFLRIPEVFGATSFRMPGTRHERWSAAPDPWFQGLFAQYWADDSLPGTVAADGTVTLAEDPSYGLEILHPFFAFNLLEELDAPGEYYLDRSTSVLYFLPPGPTTDAELRVSMMADPLLRTDGTAHVRFAGLVFELGRGVLVDARGADDVRFEACTFRNSGGDAVRIAGTDSGLDGCVVRDPGGAGVRLSGGDRPTLTPGGLFVRRSDISKYGRWDRTYKPGVGFDGCGQIVEHNRIHDAPHSGVLFTGNEHRLEFNVFERVVREANDAGAVYVGRDWGYRGNLIRWNFFHDVGGSFGGAHGVYLDDAASGNVVFGNVFYGIRGLATQSGGGRDNRFENNVVVDADDGAHMTDRRAQEVANDDWSGECPDDWNLLGRVNVVFEDCWAGARPIAYQSEPWATRYPELAAIPNDWSAVAASHWLDPEGCVFARNITWRTESLMRESTWGGEGALGFYASTEPNIDDQDPLFVDEASLDLTLRPESPAFTMPGFEAIPFREIGITP
ncbi:MAG: right-handed parallel beta-helix repeat-containing protein [Deltaproteobacteria bacterium]|nr:right-handed parallel beta-helix repeat-containing protein [Deltaproteobacteria bacterium]